MNNLSFNAELIFHFKKLISQLIKLPARLINVI